MLLEISAQELQLVHTDHAAEIVTVTDPERGLDLLDDGALQREGIVEETVSVFVAALDGMDGVAPSSRALS